MSGKRRANPHPVLGMILKGYPRISETFISNEILLLESRGIAVRIISMRRPRENFSHASVRRIRAAVDYLPERLLLPLPRFLFHNARLARRRPKLYRRALQTALRRYRRTRNIATFKHLLQAGLLVQQVLPGSGVVHLHAHFAHSPTSVAMFAARLSGLHFSFTAHAKDIYTSDPEQLAEKLQLARFAVTCTEANRNYLRGFVDDGLPIHRVYHGIDVDLFGSRTAENRCRPPYRLLTVARLTAKKGLPTVYRAIRILRDRGVALEHVLIGDGEERDRILALIGALGLSDAARWIGTQPHEVVVDHYRKADAFLLGCEVAPNGDRDGIPNVLLESMAAGVPVVATAVSAIPELVQDGRTGLLVPPEDPVRLADAVERVLTDAALRAALIPAARRQVVQHFDNRALIEDLVEIYRREVPELGCVPGPKR